MSFHHITVLLEEAVDGLCIRPDGIYVDCTLGGGGHSAAIAAKLGPQGRLIALDQDDAALENARTKLADFMPNVTLVKSNFRYLTQALREAHVPDIDGRPRVDGVLFDLGVSSPQLDEADRGFSYNHDAELDMRMDRSQTLTAAVIVNEWAEAEIARILREYGEEKFARRIARRIAAARTQAPITSTGQLVDLIKSAIPAPARRTGPHPAKRSFQALRIAVNDELDAFRDALMETIDLLKPGGRVAVITFHSLEDRICKTMFAAEVASCKCPPDFPQCVCGGGDGRLRLTPRKPTVPSARELEMNPRARSAKLRIAEKI